MGTEADDDDVPVRAGWTLTQVIALERRIDLYGCRVTDLSPRGDLGLGLDPEGPVGFAVIHGYRHGHRFSTLEHSLVLSVFGDGRAAAADDADAKAGDRVWTVAAADRALRLQVSQGTLAALLGLRGEPLAGGLT